MPKHTAGDVPTVEWRRFGSDLWAGTADFGPVGTIEHGRRFVAIDTEGNVLGRSRRLEDAQALLLSVAELQPRRSASIPDATAERQPYFFEGSGSAGFA